ncbi:hypothetical protein ES703_51009 [subsurface metagenome]
MATVKHEISKRAQTVLGPVKGGELGITLPHEHLLCDASVLFRTVESQEAELKLKYEPVTMQNLTWIWHNPFSSLDNMQLLDEELAIQVENPKRLLAFR